MATIKRYLSQKIVNGVSEIFLRISVARGKVWKFGSGVFINPARLKDDGSIHYPRANQKEVAALRNLEKEIGEVEQLIFDMILSADVASLEREMIKAAIDKYHHPDKYLEDDAPLSFFTLYEQFLKNRDLSKNRHDIYLSLGRCLHRFEMHRRATSCEDYSLEIDSITAEDLASFEQFYRDEWKLYDEFPDIYTEYPAEVRAHHKTHRPMRRGDNIVVCMMRMLRTYFNWLYAQGHTLNRPFDKYKGNKTEKYGTPFYLTIEERDHIADFDLSGSPRLEAQRDIFIFQCLVGCRVSDLRNLRASNVVRDAIEYVATKTKKDRNNVIRVPLADRAKTLIKKHAGQKDGRLFPFISDQRYNNAIKEVCRTCGINRIVTVINPTTGKDERRPIWEVASSHMARRTFIGNLYKKVKDPNLVGSLSGHKEGSKAFARYRDIDEEMKREMIDLIQ